MSFRASMTSAIICLCVKGGIGSAAKEPTAGKALIEFLTSFAATPAIKGYGLEAIPQ